MTKRASTGLPSCIVSRARGAGYVVFSMALVFSCWQARADAIWPTGPFTWSQGKSQLPLGKTEGNDKFICVLTKVTGEFQGKGEAVRLEKVSPDGYLLHGTSGQQDVGASSYCVSVAQFKADSTAWEFRDQVGAHSGGGACEKDPFSVEMLDTKWASFISGISGDLEGGGEYVQVEQGRSGMRSRLAVHGCGDNGYVDGRAVSFYVGTGPEAIFIGGEYSVKAGQNETKSVRMAPVDQAICGFTLIGGKFRGGGEYVDISPGSDGRWTLTAHSQADDGLVAARARCYSRDQRHGAGPDIASAAPLDLVPTGTDPNGLYLNPQWAYTLKNHAIPDPLAVCAPGRKAQLMSRPCTTQEPYLDVITPAGVGNVAGAIGGALAGSVPGALAGGVLGTVIGPVGSAAGWFAGAFAGWVAGGGKSLTPELCKKGSSDIDGHLNWLIATYEGVIAFHDHQTSFPVLGDDDYNWELAPTTYALSGHPGDLGAGLVKGNGGTPLTGNGGTLHLEHDARESIDLFDQAWWSKFHDAVDHDLTRAKDMVRNHRAIVTGLVGLDMAHDAPTNEIHPVFALAIETNDSPDQNTWAVFVRNFGDEGECAQDMHYMDLEDGIFRLLIPFEDGATDVTVTGLDFRTAAKNPVTTLKPQVVDADGKKHLELQFRLPPWESKPYTDGEVHLRWTIPPSGARTALRSEALHFAAAASREPPLEHGEPEDEIRSALLALTPQQLAALHSALEGPARRPNPPQIAAPQLSTSAPLLASRHASVRHVPDPELTEGLRHAIQMLALCSVTGGNATRMGELLLACPQGRTPPRPTPPPPPPPPAPPEPPAQPPRLR